MSSYWKISAGTASVLGKKHVKSDAQPTTAYLMLGEHCHHNCCFCAQARDSAAKNSLLSRITWPECPAEAATDGIAAAYEQGRLKRACLQVMTSSANLAQTFSAVKQIHAASDVPICVASELDTIEQAASLFSAGSEKICIALDAATAELHRETKGGSWEEKWQLLASCAQAFPGRVATHLIVGLGETEQELVTTLAACLNQKITVGLFAFTPIKGTAWGERLAPDIGRYRRIQIAHYLLKNGYSLDQIIFDQGHIIGFNCDSLAKLIADGQAFETSGCPDCNRPYYNERPGGILFNYPRPLTRQECQIAMAESGVVSEGYHDELAIY